MGLLATSLACAFLIVFLSAFFGFLPLLFSKKLVKIDPSHPDHSISRKENVCLAFLLNFGGGVLLANCFCHWLPEVREGIIHYNGSSLPLAEIIMCSGFFFICFLEELIQFLRNLGHGRVKVSPENESSEDQLKSAVRTFFVVCALSFHSVIEGLALTLEETSSGLWVNFGALAMHKFVIAFALGVELLSVQVTRMRYILSIGIFSLAPAVGVLIGVGLIANVESDKDGYAFICDVLQGLATGTIVYIVFFEIFPKGKEIGGLGYQHVLAMTLGFVMFLPSLFFHSHGDHVTGSHDH